MPPHYEDEKLVRDHSERLARLESCPDKIDKLADKIDALTQNVIALRTERNMIVAVTGIIAGLIGGFLGRKF